MDAGVLDVLAVQAALIPKILLELLFNIAHHGQPAGERKCPQRSEAVGARSKMRKWGCHFRIPCQHARLKSLFLCF